MNKTDLSLVAIDDLLDEVQNRCTAFVCGYTTPESDRYEKYIVRNSKGNSLILMGLCEGIKADVINYDNERE